MSSYFDKASALATFEEAKRIGQCNPMYQVKMVELGVVDDCFRIAGDREFPPHLRERIMKAIALHACNTHFDLEPRDATMCRIERCGRSVLIDEMHSIFHDVARSRTETRFGMMNDSPSYMLVLREDYNNELAEKLRGA